MVNIETWLTEYGKSHQHPANRTIHKIAVPLIVLSLIGLAWSVSFVLVALLVFAGMLFYARLSLKLAIGMLLFFALEICAVYWLEQNLRFPLWLVSITIFVVAWILQFVGHAVEGKKPSFLQDLLFLLIGPAWVVAPIYRAIGIKF